MVAWGLGFYVISLGKDLMMKETFVLYLAIARLWGSPCPNVLNNFNPLIFLITANVGLVAPIACVGGRGRGGKVWSVSHKINAYLL